MTDISGGLVLGWKILFFEAWELGYQIILEPWELGLFIVIIQNYTTVIIKKNTAIIRITLNLQNYSKVTMSFT